jgi:Flp pilus assembly secretin CpaC/tetratricopeptide (TPR) repeat protein
MHQIAEEVQPVKDSSHPSTARGGLAVKSSPQAEGGRIDAESGQPVSAQQGGSQSPAAQRRNFLIRTNLKKARRAWDLRLFEDVVKATGDVLRLDPNNEEARSLLRKAQTALGERDPSLGQASRDALTRAEIEKQKDRAMARTFENKAEIYAGENDFEKAIESYQRALLTLRYSPWFTPGSTLEKRLQAKLKQAKAMKTKWIQSQAENNARAARMKLAAEERKERIRRRVRVRYLFEQANLAFQGRQYDQAVRYLDEALKIDAVNRDAKDLRELAMRARHDQSMDSLKRKWRQEWTATFEDLKRLDITQVDTVKLDLEHWRKVSKRKPLSFTSTKVTVDPDTALIRKKLNEVVIQQNFSETTIGDWVDAYRRATGLNFLVSSAAQELEDTATTLNLKLGKRSVAQGLDLIARVKPIQWTIRDGVVMILGDEESTGTLVPVIYDVREIVNKIKDHPGKDLILRPGEAQEAPEPPDPVPAVVDLDKLQSIITTNIDPASWEKEGAGVEPSGETALVITQTPAVHKKIDALLKDLRSSSGIQVDVEARFLRIEDNFLEEIGVDFRGLGNQASTGKPGLGLQKQGDRAGFAFDDFGRNISASQPGSLGTGFEPGAFYDNGGDGDIWGRTENLFDQTLGGGPEGLSNAGGLSFQYTFLDDTELEVILRSVSKKERVEQLAAPRLLIHNAARANLAVNRQFTYIRDFSVEIAQSAAVADPVIGVIRDGVVLDVRPVVSADRRFILMELRPTVATLTQPIPTFTTTLGVGQPVSIQIPRLTVQKVRTTITMPDNGKLLLGGMKSTQKQKFESGVPILKDIPFVGFFFRKKGTYNANKKILILLRAKIIIPSETEPDLSQEER